MTASERLAIALRPLWGPLGCAKLDDCATFADVSAKVARIAARGRDVSVDHHLRLSAAIGHDPFIDGRFIVAFQLGRFNRADFATTVRRYRKDDKRANIETGAKAMGISVRALSFIENGRVVCIDATLAACRYVGIHPFAFAGFHGKQRCNPLTTQVAA